MKYFSVTKKILFLALLMGFHHVEAASISARAGAAFFAPPTAPISESVANGDFFITGGTRGGAIGNGGDESTLWAMNFRKDRKVYNAFRKHHPTTLNSATLKLRLTPKTSGIHTDAVKIFGLDWIDLDLNSNSNPMGVTTAIKIDLLNYYTDVEILDALTRNRTTGVLFMIYQDDAIVSYAEIVLKY